MTKNQKEKRIKFIHNIREILSGKSNKKIICIGPCSADDEKAVLDYMERLARISEKLRRSY